MNGKPGERLSSSQKLVIDASPAHAVGLRNAIEVERLSHIRTLAIPRIVGAAWRYKDGLVIAKRRPAQFPGEVILSHLSRETASKVVLREVRTVGNRILVLIADECRNTRAVAGRAFVSHIRNKPVPR